MKLSRQYLLGLGSGLILSALIALLFTPLTTKSPSTVGANPIVESPAETPTQAAASPTAQPAASAQGSAKSFVIPPGASAEKIAQLLQNEGWTQNKDDFLTIVKTQKLEKRFKAGTYELTPGLSIDNIINQLMK